MSKQLETYLQQVQVQLRMLPKARRDEELGEIRQHLESLITDSMERGASESAAVESAIRQFGPAQDNGRALRQVWKRKQARPFRRVLLTTASLMFGVELISRASLWIIMRIMESRGVTPHGFDSCWYMVIAGSFSAGIYFLGGWLSGIMVPRRVKAYALCECLLVSYCVCYLTLHISFSLAMSCCWAWGAGRWMQQRRQLTVVKR